MPKEQVVKQVVGSPKFAVSRSQGHQSHWSVFEPLLGTSVLDCSFAGVSGLVVAEEVASAFEFVLKGIENWHASGVYFTYYYL